MPTTAGHSHENVAAIKKLGVRKLVQERALVEAGIGAVKSSRYQLPQAAREVGADDGHLRPAGRARLQLEQAGQGLRSEAGNAGGRLNASAATATPQRRPPNKRRDLVSAGPARTGPRSAFFHAQFSGHTVAS